MRFAFVPFVLLACSSVHAATATTTTDPTIEDQRIDMSRPPPPPTSVNVLNFPEVQAVEGTVSVGNLPLDADGAVRVTSTCPTAPPLQARYVNLLAEGPISLQQGEQFASVAVDARGYSRIGVDAAGDWVTVFIEWTWSNIPELFATVTDNRNGAMQNTCIDTFLQVADGTQARRFVCVVSGEQVRLRVAGYTSPAPLSVLGVYLIP